MNEPLIEHVTHIRVRYADTDKMGIVYYGKYFEYFEVARTELLRACGLPYAAIEAAGYGLPVLEASARYFRGARYDDLLEITVRLEARVSPRLVISYDLAVDGEKIAEGSTTLGFVHSASGKPSRPPHIYATVMEQHLERWRMAEQDIA